MDVCVSGDKSISVRVQRVGEEHRSFEEGAAQNHRIGRDVRREGFVGAFPINGHADGPLRRVALTVPPAPFLTTASGSC